MTTMPLITIIVMECKEKHMLITCGDDNMYMIDIYIYIDMI